MLYSINRPNLILRLPLLLEYWAICVLQVFVSQVVTSFESKPLFYMTKKSGRKLQYLENGKSFKGEIGSISHARQFTCQESYQS